MKDKKKVGIIVQARMASTRLPGKVMMKVSGKTLLEHLILRLKKVRQADEIIIATTENKADDIIAEHSKGLGIKVFRGSEENVLERYYLAAKEAGLTVIVRVTSDCPVMDPEMVDRCISFFFEKQPADYISNCMKRSFPVGLDVEVFSFDALERTHREAEEAPEKEHVAPYMYRHPEKFKLAFLENDKDESSYRLTVDTAEDLELIKKIYEVLYPKDRLFGAQMVMELFKKRPELKKINEKVHQKKVGE